jgi:hypothetical protein
MAKVYNSDALASSENSNDEFPTDMARNPCQG